MALKNTVAEQRILITQARAGMILARAVTLENGTNLCGEGSEISDELIQRFIIRGIVRIFVTGTPIPSASMKPLALRIEELNERFSRISKDPRMHFLRQAIETEMSK